MFLTDAIKKPARAITAALCLCATPGLAVADNNLQQGNQAFRDGNFGEALTHFEQAYQLGNRSPALRYNRAVTLYKLARLDAAEAAFRELLKEPKWAALAHYNLGRLNEERGRQQAAREHYEKALAITDNPRLREIATRKLAGFKAQRVQQQTQQNAGKPRQQTAQKAEPKKGAALVSLGLTHDDNASGLADELAGRSSDSQDQYLSLLAYGQYYLQGKAKAGTKIYGLSQTRRFDSFDSFNTQVTGAGLTLEAPWRQWQSQAGARLLVIQVDNNTLANQFTVSGKLGKDWQQGYLEADYQLSYFAAGDQFEHLNGWQQKLGVSWEKSLSAVTFEPAIIWEYNHRDDKTSGNNFYSYSFNNLSLQTKAHSDISEQWRLYGEVSWGVSWYADDNRHNDLDGNRKEKPRETRSGRLKAGARYRLAKHWQIKAEYSYKTVADTFELYTYDKNQLTLKVDYLW